MVACTAFCCYFNYIQWSVAEWSKLSFSSPELLHGCRFESYRWLYSVYTNKKSSHPSSLSCVLAVAPTMKRSAVQPKTTRLCSSIRVISLWLHLFLPWQTHVFIRRFRIILGPSSTMQHCWLFSAIWTEKLALTNFKKKIAAPNVQYTLYSTLICLDRMILICMHGYQFVAYTKWGKSLFFNIFYTFFV